MWRYSLLLQVALLGLGSTLWAQEKAGTNRVQGDRKNRTEHLLTFLTDTLKLTPDQQEKVKPLLENHVSRAQEIRRSEQDRQKRQRLLWELRQQTDAAISEVLMPEQKATWDKIKADWRRRARANWEKRTGQKIPEED